MAELPAKETTFLDNIEMGLGAWSWGDRFFWHYGHGYTDEDIAAAFRTIACSRRESGRHCRSLRFGAF